MDNQNFNPRSPYGERPCFTLSILAFSQFQSTLPLRGATRIIKPDTDNLQFQSTLPLTGSDSKTAQNFT